MLFAHAMKLCKSKLSAVLIALLVLTVAVIVTIVGVYIVKDYLAERKIVETKAGLVQGIVSISRNGREFYEWLGIPYAKPPVGKLRFASSKPTEKWDGIRDASQYGSGCLQNSMFLMNSVIGDEDCLYLNIHSPKLANETVEQEGLPVLVYIHAGAFLAGSSSMYRPEYFMDEDVILISINYRLDILGFLTTGDDVIRGNMGLKDQVLALKWIQENIRNFGGDPSKVTIFGHSAGGASVQFLLLSPLSKGLFQKAISHSGSAMNPWSFVTPTESFRRTKTVAKSLGCPVNGSQQIADCLRSASVTELMKTVWRDSIEAPSFQPHKFGQPIIPTIEAFNDGEAFLSETPLAIITSGKAHRIPWMVGHTAEEGLLSTLAFTQDETALEDFEQNWDSCIKSIFAFPSSPSNNTSMRKKAKDIRDFYFPPSTRSKLKPEQRMKSYTQLFGDSFFNFDIRESIFYQRDFSPVYPYVYNRTGGPTIAQLLEIVLSSRSFTTLETMIYNTKQFLSSLFGTKSSQPEVAYHIADVNFLFPFYPVFDIPKGSADYEFSKSYVKLLVDFANDDSSLVIQGVRFPATSKTGKLKFLEITNDTPKVTTEPFEKRMEFLHALNIRSGSEG